MGDILFTNAINIYVVLQIIFYLLFICGVCLNSLVFIQLSFGVFNGSWGSYVCGFRFGVMGLIVLIGFLNLYLLYDIHFNTLEYHTELVNYMFEKHSYVFFMWKSLKFSVNELSLTFIVLISFLYPLILILLQYDLSVERYKYYSYMIWLYCVIYVFIFTVDLLVWYIVYELMICLVFYVMYLTANNRGCLEAILFFFGWASVGSFLVGCVIVYIVVVGDIHEFGELQYICFTINERYFIYLCVFFGFGTKLSIWPFWYWLPRAHVEVSTSLSIFLSCVLVKVCFYGLIRVFLCIGGEILIVCFIFFVGLSVFDVTVRLILQTDLKAITAYGSVLHVNLLILLFLLDTSVASHGLIFYIWGHSYATAGMFYVIHLIERCCGTRLVFELGGLYQLNPLIAIFSILAFIAFLEFPLIYFFWGELWLWVVMVELIPLSTFILLFISVGIYIIIFFWIWWNIIFGNIPQTCKGVYIYLSYEDMWVGVYIICSQYLVGMQPHILCWCTSG